MHIPFHQFEIKFLHVTAMAQVVIEKGLPHAVITFPLAYCPGTGNGLFYGFPIPDMEWEEVEAYVTARFKDNFSFLNARIREIGKHNFFISRILFRTCVEREIGDFKVSFPVTKHVYAISENVDGIPWHKTKLEGREFMSTMKAHFIVNWDGFIHPALNAGFNDKFIRRTLKRYDKVKAHHLRLKDNIIIHDNITGHPEAIAHPIEGRRFEFMAALGDYKKRLL